MKVTTRRCIASRRHIASFSPSTSTTHRSPALLMIVVALMVSAMPFYIELPAPWTMRIHTPAAAVYTDAQYNCTSCVIDGAITFDVYTMFVNALNSGMESVSITLINAVFTDTMVIRGGVFAALVNVIIVNATFTAAHTGVINAVVLEGALYQGSTVAIQGGEYTFVSNQAAQSVLLLNDNFTVPSLISVRDARLVNTGAIYANAFVSLLSSTLSITNCTQETIGSSQQGSHFLLQVVSVFTTSSQSKLVISDNNMTHAAAGGEISLIYFMSDLMTGASSVLRIENNMVRLLFTTSADTTNAVFLFYVASRFQLYNAEMFLTNNSLTTDLTDGTLSTTSLRTHMFVVKQFECVTRSIMFISANILNTGETLTHLASHFYFTCLAYIPQVLLDASKLIVRANSVVVKGAIVSVTNISLSYSHAAILNSKTITAVEGTILDIFYNNVTMGILSAALDAAVLMSVLSVDQCTFGASASLTVFTNVLTQLSGTEHVPTSASWLQVGTSFHIEGSENIFIFIQQNYIYSALWATDVNSVNRYPISITGNITISGRIYSTIDISTNIVHVGTIQSLSTQTVRRELIVLKIDGMLRSSGVTVVFSKNTISVEVAEVCLSESPITVSLISVGSVVVEKQGSVVISDNTVLIANGTADFNSTSSSSSPTMYINVITVTDVFLGDRSNLVIQSSQLNVTGTVRNGQFRLSVFHAMALAVTNDCALHVSDNTLLVTLLITVPSTSTSQPIGAVDGVLVVDTYILADTTSNITVYGNEVRLLNELDVPPPSSSQTAMSASIVSFQMPTGTMSSLLTVDHNILLVVINSPNTSTDGHLVSFQLDVSGVAFQSVTFNRSTNASLIVESNTIQAQAPHFSSIALLSAVTIAQQQQQPNSVVCVLANNKLQIVNTSNVGWLSNAHLFSVTSPSYNLHLNLYNNVIFTTASINTILLGYLHILSTATITVCRNRRNGIYCTLRSGAVFTCMDKPFGSQVTFEGCTETLTPTYTQTLELFSPEQITFSTAHYNQTVHPTSSLSYPVATRNISNTLTLRSYCLSPPTCLATTAVVRSRTRIVDAQTDLLTAINTITNASCTTPQLTLGYGMWTADGGTVVMTLTAEASAGAVLRPRDESEAEWHRVGATQSAVEYAVVEVGRNETTGTGWVVVAVRYTGTASLTGTSVTLSMSMGTVFDCDAGTPAWLATSFVSLTLANAPALPPNVGAVADTVVVVTAVTGAVSGVMSGIVQSGIANAMLEMLRCSVFVAESEVDFVSNPGGWAVGRASLQYQRGSLLLVLILMSCVCVASCCAVGVVYARSDKNASVLAAVGRARLPSLLVVPVMVSSSMALPSGTSMLMYGDASAGDRVLAIAVIAPLWAYLCLFAYRSTAGLRVGFGPIVEEVDPEEDNADVPTWKRVLQYVVVPTHGPVLPTVRVSTFAADRGEDGVRVVEAEDDADAPEPWLRRNYFFVADRRWPAYGGVEAIVGSLVDMLEGIPLTTRSTAACVARPAAMCVLLVMLMVLLVVKWPNAVRFQQASALCVTGLLLVANVMVVVNAAIVAPNLEAAAGQLISSVSLVIVVLSMTDLFATVISIVPSIRRSLGINRGSLSTTIGRIRLAITRARDTDNASNAQPLLPPSTVPLHAEDTSDNQSITSNNSVTSAAANSTGSRGSKRTDTHPNAESTPSPRSRPREDDYSSVSSNDEPTPTTDRGGEPHTNRYNKYTGKLKGMYRDLGDAAAYEVELEAMKTPAQREAEALRLFTEEVMKGL